MDKKEGLPLYFLAAMTWFGYHCGAGFASGAQVRIYAAQYGRAGVIVPFIAWTACTVFMYIVCEYARLIKAESYRDVGYTIYSEKKTVGRTAVLLWDILIFMSSITAVGSCVAGSGALLNQLTQLPYWIGCAVFIVFMIMLLCFGKNILERLGKLGTALVIVFFIVCLTGLVSAGGHAAEVMTTGLGAPVAENASLMTLLRSGMTYGIVQIGSFQALVVMSGKFRSKADTVRFSLLGFALNCGAMLLSFLSLMGYYPEIIEKALPTLGIIQNMTGGLYIALMAAYNFVLVMAYITTAGAMIAGGQARYVSLLQKRIKSSTVCRILVTVVFMGSATALSVLGLDGILTTVNSINAAARTPIWFIPLLILGPLAIRRAGKNTDI